jgi:cyclopropane fatty-acyl-phospholipid synthase-like methyltransferase
MIRKSVVRACHPSHVWQAISLQRNRKKNRRVVDDAQLQLYSEILPREFLHFGYFDDPATKPEDISLNSIMNAQERYAEHLLDQVIDRENPVFDIGCGMGVISAMLMKRGFSPVALTPDRHQIAHLRSKYPSISSLHCKFEDIDIREHAGKYGTLLNSESLQYLDLDRSLPLVDKLVKPGGRWVACDFFRRDIEKTCSGQHYETFLSKLHAMGWKVTFHRDISANIAPTLKFVYMLAARFGLPLYSFGTMKLKKKQPAAHYLLEPFLTELKSNLTGQLHTIDPEAFVARQQYLMLVMERA